MRAALATVAHQLVVRPSLLEPARQAPADNGLANQTALVHVGRMVAQGVYRVVRTNPGATIEGEVPAASDSRPSGWGNLHVRPLA